jgi:hypothetical protein
VTQCLGLKLKCKLRILEPRSQEAFEQFGVLLGLGAEVEGSPAAERMSHHWQKYWGVSMYLLRTPANRNDPPAG